MCGLILAGPKHSPARVEKALEAMSYRGAEGLRGVIGWRGWTIGHVRLAIQDLTENGAQPVVQEDRVFAFVGEVFNHGGSEKEAIANALKFSSFDRLDGFWSVVEITRGGAYAYTDFLGIKPLYYWPSEGIVCSEIRPMFELADKPPLDKIYLSNCIKWGYDYTGRTPWQGIYQLAPGTRLNLSSGTEGRYWDWNHVPGSPDDLRQELEKAISNRLISDRPVSMLLSGGLDSSIIYYSLLERGLEVKAFSIENGETEFLPEGIEVLPLPEGTEREALQVMQAPLDLGSLIPQLQLAKAVAAAGFRVCMTGDGADELFGGYRRAQEYDSQASDVFCELPYYHLPRLDRVMMSQTIEQRSPFLAPRVVAVALRTPYQDRTSKQALKRAFRAVVPDPILKREKHPLKAPAVVSGGISYRRNLVQEFVHVQADF